jgi:hypothetical protein
MKQSRKLVAGLILATAASVASAAVGPVPQGISRLDHVFVIMMENHSFQQVINNPSMPYINGLIKSRKVSLATNYFAVGHPSLTNYLEIVGGSNFGVRSDNSPDWHNLSCIPNLRTKIPNADNAGGNAPYPIDTKAICPISGEGTDAVTEAVDNWNEVNPPVFNFLANIDGLRSVPAAPTIGKTIGDQLVEARLSWKSYQENLPISGADGIDNSNGTASNLTTFDPTKPLSATNLPPLTSASILAAYAVKHNPFAYFESVQEGRSRENSLENMVGFEGPRGLYSDLARGHVPSLSFIVPNQCDDQHGRGNGDAFCQFDQGTAAFSGNTDGTQLGLNPGLSEQADVTIHKIVSSIKESPAWREGRNAIVVVWDENDYSGSATALPANFAFPVQNQNTVVLTVETNDSREGSGIQSANFYSSFSLLRSLESGFRLPCLNHACDKGVNVMSDLFR